MKTLIDKKVEIGFKAILRVDGRQIVYQRGQQTAPLAALVDSVDETEVNATGYSLKHQSKTFSFLKQDFLMENAAIRPQNGDVIQMDGKRFAVVNQDSGRKWDYEDSGEQIITIKGTCET